MGAPDWNSQLFSPVKSETACKTPASVPKYTCPASMAGALVKDDWDYCHIKVRLKDPCKIRVWISNPKSTEALSGSELDWRHRRSKWGRLLTRWERTSCRSRCQSTQNLNVELWSSDELWNMVWLPQISIPCFLGLISLPRHPCPPRCTEAEV